MYKENRNIFLFVHSAFVRRTEQKTAKKITVFNEVAFINEFFVDSFETSKTYIL